jgi:hypothetical protein
VAGTRLTRPSRDDCDAQSKSALAFSDPAVWHSLVSQFYHIFLQLETALAQAAAKSQNVASVYPLLQRLARADAFLSDVRRTAPRDEAAMRVPTSQPLTPRVSLVCALPQVAYHGGGKPPCPPEPPTVEYTARLASLAASEPLLLLAHAQTMYLALLAGGAVLARMLRVARALPPGEGTAIFEFEAVLPAAEQRRFRDALRQAVDDVGVKLTGARARVCRCAFFVWRTCGKSGCSRFVARAAKERDALLSEKRAIFRRNDRVIEAVLSKASGSALRGWVTILLNLLLLPWRYTLHLARRWRRRGALLSQRALWYAKRAAPLLALAAVLYALLTHTLAL